MRLVLVAISSLLVGCGLTDLSTLVDGVGGNASSSNLASSSSSAASSTGTAAAFCDGVTATYCFDFDGADPLMPFQWEQYQSNATHGISTDRAVSMPASLWLDYPAADPPGGGHHAFYLAGTPTHVVVDVDVFRETEATGNGGLLDMRWKVGEYDCQLGIWLADMPARVGFYHQRLGPMSGMSMGLGGGNAALADIGSSIGEWLHLQADVAVDGASTTIAVTGPGGEARNDSVTASECDAGPDAGTMRVSFGAYYNAEAFQAFFDNVTIQAD